VDVKTKTLKRLDLFIIQLNDFQKGLEEFRRFMRDVDFTLI